ncbi:hypothetical protein [Polluticaenibacter yanchengensis]|uniref:Uncharacterized protein n=1 Tax=Polluticaenibacter yanchengensis TaxID=3014562 RepID=A0ABT4UKI4_9BACT|nr:hypothetical protein [Chitinophagaceae bacterium LY-5]
MQLSEINKELENIAPKLLGINKAMPFSVPDNYFELLSIEALLYTNGKAVGYAAPDLYFEEFPNRLLLKVAKTGNDTVSQSVPEGYFDHFADNLLAKIKAGAPEVAVSAETDELPAIFASIGKEMPYHVPAGYFETAVKIPENNVDSAPKQGKVVPIGNKKNWLKYAASIAAIGLLITLGVKTSNNDIVPSVATPAVAIAAAPAADIDSAVDSEFAAMLAALDSKAFVSDEVTDSGKADISEDLMSEDIESSLKKLSDKDLIAFLQTVGMN